MSSSSSSSSEEQPRKKARTSSESQAQDVDHRPGMANTLPVEKAYNRHDFLNGSHARHVRILCEYEHTRSTLEKYGVNETVMFFASARGKSRPDWEAAVAAAEAKVADDGNPSEVREKAQKELSRLKKLEWQCDVYVKVRELAARLADWGVKRMPDLPRVSICTGGGPGAMQAANEGAASIEGAYSVGMGISLPFEKGLNIACTPELAFRYHYFFTRKFWMTYPCRALVVAPGGFGTCDELFEMITLIQCKKKERIPIVLFGREFWTKIINWDQMAAMGVIAEEDVKMLKMVDSVEEAFAHITSGIEEWEQSEAGQKAMGEHK